MDVQTCTTEPVVKTRILITSKLRIAVVPQAEAPVWSYCLSNASVSVQRKARLDDSFATLTIVDA